MIEVGTSNERNPGTIEMFLDFHSGVIMSILHELDMLRILANHVPDFLPSHGLDSNDCDLDLRKYRQSDRSYQKCAPPREIRLYLRGKSLRELYRLVLLCCIHRERCFLQVNINKPKFINYHTIMRT